MIIGVTSGCFDILHPAHILFLEKCRRESQRLIILLDSDERILTTKGSYPVFNEQDRFILVDALEVVDQVYIFHDMEEYRCIIEDLITSKDGVVIFKNRKEFPNSEEPSLKFIPGTKTRIIGDVNRFSSSTEIKNFLKS